MDRDNRWERVTLAYDAMVDADAVEFKTADEAIAASYNNGKYDEFMLPVIVGDYKGMKDGDGVLMVNNTYGHLYPTRHKEVADKLNDILVSL